MRGSAFFFAFLLSLCPAGIAQDVVSASSGVLQYFEGSVQLDDHSVEHKAAVFPSLKDGSILSTGKGRAELLLTPGAYLRLDENTSVRMLSNSLADTRVEVLSGVTLLDNLNATSTDALTLVYQGSQVRFLKPGIYRIDSDLGELQAYSGQAEVQRGSAPSIPVDAQHLYYFSLEFTTEKFGDSLDDEFYDWAHNRSDMLVEQNERASAEQEESQDPDPVASGGFLGGVLSLALPAPMTPNFVYGSASSLYSYGNFSPLMNPSPAFTPFFFPSGPAVLLHPSRPVGVKWPGSGLGLHPRPILNRWPTPSYAGSSAYRSTSLTSPGYRPAVTSPAIGSHVAVPRAVPHAIGHR